MLMGKKYKRFIFEQIQKFKMNKISNILLLLIIIVISCSENPENKSVVRDKLAYELINKILSDTSDLFFKNKTFFIAEKPVFSPPIMSGFRSEKEFLMNLFEENDSLNLFSQLKKRRNFLLDSSRISNYKLVPKKYFIKNSKRDSLWEIIDTKLNGGFYIISMPFFSSDNKMVYIRIGYLCGRLCGGGHSRLYKFKNGEWKLIKKFDAWIN